MRTVHELSGLAWRVSGWQPYSWRMVEGLSEGVSTKSEIADVPARAPGSVQAALRDAGVLPDWNHGLNARACEWVENRHWLFEAALPDRWVEPGATIRLNALGLDHAGWMLVNGREAGRFEGALVPHVFDLTPHLRPENNRVQIVFDVPPRWLGQCGYTSQMTDWKPRFYYTWDWTARLVQTGIWDKISLERIDGASFGEIRCLADADPARGSGTLQVRGAVMGDGGRVRVALTDMQGTTVREEEMSAADFMANGMAWDGLPVDLWWPNGMGTQPLYTVTCTLVDDAGTVHDTDARRVGFKHVDWLPCEGAPPEADPWVCAVNGRPVFLFGVNWTPIRPNFADVTDADYRKRVAAYRDMGMNVLRVWGGAFLEKASFYDLCDEMGLLVWQEFPLSSSGLDNWPPEDETSIREMANIARSYVVRRRHHASLLLWCGGNELQGSLDGGKAGGGKPCDISHPMLARLGEVVAEEDPGRRYLPTSASGPRFTADEQDFGKGLHWDVHGPWKIEGSLETDWARYWANDDALFRSEVGCPGASGADLIEEYRGQCEALPGTVDNPLWRLSSWWIEWPACVLERGGDPESLEDYVAWSQARQAKALGIAVTACRDRFPRCGGIILWMGHDCYPCTANTSILDYYGDAKAAGAAEKGGR